MLKAERTKPVPRRAKVSFAPGFERYERPAFDPNAEFTDVRGAAYFANCSMKNIWRKLADGTLKRYRFGSRILVKMAELRAAIVAE